MKFFIFVFIFLVPNYSHCRSCIGAFVGDSEAASRVFIDHTKNLLFSEYQIKNDAGRTQSSPIEISGIFSVRAPKVNSSVVQEQFLESIKNLSPQEIATNILQKYELQSYPFIRRLVKEMLRRSPESGLLVILSIQDLLNYHFFIGLLNLASMTKNTNWQLHISELREPIDDIDASELYTNFALYDPNVVIISLLKMGLHKSITTPIHPDRFQEIVEVLLKNHPYLLESEENASLINHYFSTSNRETLLLLAARSALEYYQQYPDYQKGYARFMEVMDNVSQYIPNKKRQLFVSAFLLKDIDKYFDLPANLFLVLKHSDIINHLSDQLNVVTPEMPNSHLQNLKKLFDEVHFLYLTSETQQKKFHLNRYLQMSLSLYADFLTSNDTSRKFINIGSLVANTLTNAASTKTNIEINWDQIEYSQKYQILSLCKRLKQFTDENIPIFNSVTFSSTLFSSQQSSRFVTFLLEVFLVQLIGPEKDAFSELNAIALGTDKLIDTTILSQTTKKIEAIKRNRLSTRLIYDPNFNLDKSTLDYLEEISLWSPDFRKRVTHLLDFL